MTMGAKMPSSHQRFFSMRNPFSRCVMFAVALLMLLAITWKSDRIENVGTRIIKATQHREHAAAEQAGAAPADTQTPLNEPPVPQQKLSDADFVPVSTHKMNCDMDPARMEDAMGKWGLEDGFQYFKRYVKINRQAVDRQSITNLNQQFLPDHFTTYQRGTLNGVQQQQCHQPLEVPVPESPYPATANLSDFLFGVSTTYKRFSSEKTSPVNEWSYWMTDGRGHSNGAKLVLLLLDASEEEILHTKSVLQNIGIDVDVYHSDSSMEMAVRYLTLVPTLYNHPERVHRKWLVVCDDDTFFPNPHRLANRLQTFDHNEQLYIGVLSEDVSNVDRHGSQAFGGAGVFISVPLAEQISILYEGCRTDQKVQESNSGWGAQGDILLRKCIYENTETRLTLLPGLYQLDLYGDPSGFYEGGLELLSLHHFKGGGWHVALPAEYTKLATLGGEDLTLMRFRTADNFIISSGFSVAHYPLGINFNTHQLERTFGAAPQDKGWNMDWAFGPQRANLQKTGRKMSWDLQEAVYNVEENTLTHYYVRKSNDWRWVDQFGEPMSTADGLIELVWIP